MNQSEFNDGISELAEYYGEAAVNSRVVAIVWRFASGLTAAEFKRVIDDLVENHPRAPSIASIKKAALPYIRLAEQRRQQARLEQLENLGQTCQLCGHSGYVLALLRTDPAKEFSFRCPACPAAKVRRIDLRIREWSDELKPDYLPVSLRMESHEAAAKLQKEHRAKVHLSKRPAQLAVANDELLAMANEMLKQTGVQE